MDDGFEFDGLPIDEKQFYADSPPGEDTLFHLDGREFRSINELAEYMRSLFDSSHTDFKRLCHKLVNYNGELDPRFAAWIITMGKEKELAEWRVSISEFI